MRLKNAPAIFDGDLRSVGINYIPDLIELYAETGRSERAREALDRLLRSGLRSQGSVHRAAEAYRAIDSEAADEILNKVNELMAGPEI